MTKILIIGEAWGADEEREKKPFVGWIGQELNRLLEDAMILPPESSNDIARARWRRDEIFFNAGVALTNTFNLRPEHNKIETLCSPRAQVTNKLPPLRAGQYLQDRYLPELDRLFLEIETIDPNVIVCTGAVPTWALLGSSAITKYRGTLNLWRGRKVIPTFHPSYLLRGAWENRPEVVFDFEKAKRESEYKEVRKRARQIFVPETSSDLYDLLRLVDECFEFISVDIETRGDQITCIGFAYSPDLAIVIPFVDYRQDNNSYWQSVEDERRAWLFVRHECARPEPKVLQNGLYDVAFIWRTAGFTVNNFQEDTMLAHHAIQPEARKGLDFLASIYVDEVAWKQMRPRGKGTIKRDE